MRTVAPSALLRHRPPALLLGDPAHANGDTLTCPARGDGPFDWPQLLEGAAQAAGLLAGLQPGGPDRTAVIAEYRDVEVAVPRHRGAVVFDVRLERRLLHFWRCRCEARAADGTLLVRGRVTIAPERP